MRLALLSAILRIRVSPETLLIGPRASFGRAGGSFALASEEEIRRRLIRALGDPAALDGLRRFWGQWQSEASRVGVLSNRQLIDRVAAMAAGGPLAAYVSPDTGMRHTPGASGKKLGERRQRAESAVVEARRRRAAASAVPGAASSLPPGLRTAAATPAAPPLPFGSPSVASTTAALQGLSGAIFRVSAMTLEQRLEEVLRRTASSKFLGVEMGREFMQLLEPAALATIVMVLAVWAGSHAVGIGFIIDAIIAVAGLLIMGWAVIDAAEKLYQALEITRNARTEADLDAAADLLAQVIAALGVAAFMALVTHGAGRVARVAQPTKTGLPRTVSEARPPPQRLIERPAPGAGTAAEAAAGEQAAAKAATQAAARDLRQQLEIKNSKALAKGEPQPYPDVEAAVAERMAGWQKVSAQGFPNGFKDKEAFAGFKQKIVSELQKFGAPTDDIGVHGSAVSKANPKDIDVGIRVDKATFDKLVEQAKLAKPGSLERINKSASKGILPSYFQPAVDGQTFPQAIYGAAGDMKMQVSFILKDGSFDIGPYLKF